MANDEKMFALWQHWSERVAELLGEEWEIPSKSVRGTTQMLWLLRLFEEGKLPEEAAAIVKEVNDG